MKRAWLLSRLPWVGIALLVVLLGAVQHRWLEDVVRAERRGLAEVLRTASEQVADELDRQLSRVFIHFQPPAGLTAGEESDRFFAEAFASWREEGGSPDLVRAVFSIERGRDGSFDVRQLDPASGRFEPRGWPSRLEATRRRLEQPFAEAAGSFGPIPYPLLPELPGLVVPLDQTRRAVVEAGVDLEADADEDAGRAFEAHVVGFLSSVLVVELDAASLRSTLIPELLDRYRLGAGSDYEATIRVRSSGEQVFSSAAEPMAEEEVAVRTPIFALRPLAEMRSMAQHLRSHELSRRESAGLNLAAIVTAIGGDESGWELAVGHREGSLAAVVKRNQVRHLWVIAGLMAVLGLALWTILLSNRRAQSLARQQVEFVAGVSHELRTPLASIKSLAQNLSRGLVHEPEQVKRYGAMIEREEVRLMDMVDQVLQFSGALSRREAFARAGADLRKIVGQGVEAMRPAVAAAGKEIVLEGPDAPLPILADGEALGRAVQNLVGNAVKYGGDSRWIRVEVAAEEGAGPRSARVTVSDSGPGIRREELSRVFEPFYRTAEAKASQVPGSGLGLSFVRRVAEGHGGRVEARSRRGEGAAFTIVLPLEQEPGP